MNGPCWVGPEEYACKKMENKNFGQEGMAISSDGNEGQTQSDVEEEEERGGEEEE